MPPKSYTEALTPSVIAVGEGGSKELVKIKWGQKGGGPDLTALMSLKEETPKKSLSLPLSLPQVFFPCPSLSPLWYPPPVSLHAHKEEVVSVHSKMVATYLSSQEASEQKTMLPAPWSASTLIWGQTCEKRFCWKYPVWYFVTGSPSRLIHCNN